MRNGHPHQGQEQDVEQVELTIADGQEDDDQSRRNGRRLARRGYFRQAPGGCPFGAVQEKQERGDHGNADRIPQPVLEGQHRQVGRGKDAVQDEHADEGGGHDGGAQESDADQPADVGDLVQGQIDRRSAAQGVSGDAIPGDNDEIREQQRWDGRRMSTHHKVGQDKRDIDHRHAACPGPQQQGHIKPGRWIPRRDVEARTRVDEGQPVDGQVRRQEGKRQHKHVPACRHGRERCFRCAAGGQKRHFEAFFWATRTDKARTIRPPDAFAYSKEGSPAGLPSRHPMGQPMKNGCVPCAAMALDSLSSAWA